MQEPVEEAAIVANKVSEVEGEAKKEDETQEKPIEEILADLCKGSTLWKVRSFSRWYRRVFYIDEEAQMLRYHPSLKSLRCVQRNKVEIHFSEIKDVRCGWRTDVFNSMSQQISRQPPSRRMRLDENTCFSLVVGKGRDASATLDLVASSEEICRHWVRGLRHVLYLHREKHEGDYFDRWLKRMFDQADGNKDGTLSFEECLKFLKQINVKLRKSYAKKLFDEANTVMHETEHVPVLDANEFLVFFHLLTYRREINEIFNRYSAHPKEMNAQELCNFLQNEQNLKFHPQACLSLIQYHEQSDLKKEGKLSVTGFTDMLLSERFELCDPEHLCIVHQNMKKPLSHYYIASSHNTYLTGNQLSGKSSLEGYIEALKRGCRCVELDCWDGPDGEPIIYHGYTLTSKILFKDVLTDAIVPYAFMTSDYPVILSLENHCSEVQQDRLADHLKNVLGGLLYLQDATDLEQLPSPEELRRRIIVKAKKLRPKISGEIESSESEPDEVEDEQGTARKTVDQTTGASLSGLVNICEAVHFHSFDRSRELNKCYTISSFSENTAMKLAEIDAAQFIDYNKRQLSRIYPAGKRTGSSNYDPLPLWNVGCQIVALNYQSFDRPNLLNDAKFKVNGSCGYILKPEYFRAEENCNLNAMVARAPTTLRLSVISGQHIPKPEEPNDGDIVDPYVQVQIIGHQLDNKKYKTLPVRDNGLNPYWGETFEWQLLFPELALMLFTVRDDNNTGKDAILGTYAMPISSMQTGYRHVYLLNYVRQVVAPTSLFVHVSMKT